MRFVMNDIGQAPWNQIAQGTELISDAGVPSSPRPTEITYEITVLGGSPPLRMLLTLDKWAFAGNTYSRWRCRLLLGFTEQSEALAVQPFPQYTVAVDRFLQNVPSFPYTSIAGPPLYFRPATYAQGGSPY